MFKVQFDWTAKSPSLACAGHMKSLESLPHPQSAAWLTKVEEELGPRRMPGTVQGRTLDCQSGIALLTSLKRKKGQECGAFAEREQFPKRPDLAHMDNKRCLGRDITTLTLRAGRDLCEVLKIKSTLDFVTVKSNVRPKKARFGSQTTGLIGMQKNCESNMAELLADPCCTIVHWLRIPTVGPSWG